MKLALPDGVGGREAKPSLLLYRSSVQAYLVTRSCGVGRPVQTLCELMLPLCLVRAR